MPEDTGTGREVALTDGVEATTVAGRLPAHVEQTARATREYAEAARVPNTLRAYRSDVEDFSTYCRAELGGADPLPAAP